MPRIKNWEKKIENQGPRSETVWKNTETGVFVRLIQAERGKWLIERSETVGFESRDRLYQTDISKRIAKKKVSKYMRNYPKGKKPSKYWDIE